MREYFSSNMMDQVTSTWFLMKPLEWFLIKPLELHIIEKHILCRNYEYTYTCNRILDYTNLADDIGSVITDHAEYVLYSRSCILNLSNE